MEPPRIADAIGAVRHVFVRDMTLEARIGVHAAEKRAPQPVRFNIDLAVEDEGARPLSHASVGRDNLSRVVDYEPIVAAVRRIVAERHFALAETLAERIAEAALIDPRVIFARVRVEKLDVFRDVAAVGVEIERRRA
ncbi:MAG: dihydroneopterin aldolase [Rhodospirillales bacterium]|nr:dihydroneopterin aldolase [Rhodospirillales bacterium]